MMKLSKQQFIFVKYNDVDYPQGFSADIHEVAAHFDKIEIEAFDKYSLHTEYSYGKRKLDSPIISKYPNLLACFLLQFYTPYIMVSILLQHKYRHLQLNMD